MTTTEVQRRRAPAPPARAPAPAANNDKLYYGNADPAKAAQFWDSLKWDSSKLDQKNFTGDRPTVDDARDGAQGHADQAGLTRWEGQGPTNAIAGNFSNGSSAYGSIGSQGGIQPVQGKPGYYEVVRQPAGNHSYNLVKAEYKVGPDGKTLQRTGDWTPISFDSDTKWGQNVVKAAAIVGGAAALGLGTGAAEGAGTVGAADGISAGATAEGGTTLGVAGSSAEAGMGIGEIGASQLTPALAESATGAFGSEAAGGYGLSSAGLGYAGAGGSAAGGVAGFNTAATNPALIESATSNPEYGYSSASPGFSGGSSGLTANQYRQLGEQASKMGNSGGQQGGQQHIDGVDLAALAALEAQHQRELEQIARSSKKAKVANHGGISEALRRGVRGDDAIDANGVEIASIQELRRKLQGAKDKLAALKHRKGRH